VSERPKYKGATCRGSIALGTACEDCEACVEERRRLSANTLTPHPHTELCANCDLTYAGHLSNTYVLHPCWKPSGRYQNPPKALAPKPKTGTTIIWSHDISATDVLGYLNDRITTATSETQIARWAGVLSSFHAAVLGDRKEQMAAADLKRLGGSSD
jgi:hypothetical protein